MPLKYRWETYLGKDRSRSSIMADVLDAVRESRSAARTRIMQRACLDWNCFKKYFSFLVERGFLAESVSDAGRYELTDKGRELLKLQKDFYRLCSE